MTNNPDAASYKIEISGEGKSWWGSVTELGVTNPATWDVGEYPTKADAIEATQDLVGEVVHTRFYYAK